MSRPIRLRCSRSGSSRANATGAKLPLQRAGRNRRRGPMFMQNFAGDKDGRGAEPRQLDRVRRQTPSIKARPTSCISSFCRRPIGTRRPFARTRTICQPRPRGRHTRSADLKWVVIRPMVLAHELQHGVCGHDVAGFCEAGALRFAFGVIAPSYSSIYRCGLNTTVASGGRVNTIEAGRPWLSLASAMMPPPLPRSLPP